MGHVLIYGGSGATGAAAARLLVAAGYAVHLAGRNESRLAAIAAELVVSRKWWKLDGGVISG